MNKLFLGLVLAFCAFSASAHEVHIGVGIGGGCHERRWVHHGCCSDNFIGFSWGLGHYECRQQIVLVSPERCESIKIIDSYQTISEFDSCGNIVTRTIPKSWHWEVRVTVPAIYETREVRVWCQD